jgi:hypothetical protein
MPGAQSASERQSGKHWPIEVSQLNGAQMICGPAAQRPAPSQSSTSTTAPLWHVPAWQTVPTGYCRQLPCPSQVPSVPQVATSDLWQAARDGGAVPAGTNVQSPDAPGTLHALHVSVQALSQQTPSAQNPLSQSAAHPQAWPFATLPAFPPLHEISAPPSPRAARLSAALPPVVRPQAAARMPTIRRTTACARARADARGAIRRRKLIDVRGCGLIEAVTRLEEYKS